MNTMSGKQILTTLVRIKGSSGEVVPVKSREPIDKELFIECSKALSRLYVGTPIKCGDLICQNILNTGVDIIATKNINKK
ncbi:CxxC motif-containing protein [Clostridium acetobutylicum]|nr:CxxC motif-containing protein [Clostridium acetobutylicum]